MATNPVSLVGRFFGRFFGNTIGEAAAYGIGGAMQEPIRPLLQTLANETWATATATGITIPPQAYVLAEGVAQGQVDESAAREWAHQQGYNDAVFTALIDIANTGPALGLAYSAWRRGELTDAEFTTALKRTGLEEQWFGALKALKEEPLPPGTIATAVHRGIMPDPTLILREPPTTPGQVPQVPPSPLDPVTEAAWHGLNHERLRVEVGTTGLPPGLGEMLQLLNRGEVTVDDVQRAVAQSNLRNEYMDVVLGLRRRLLTPSEYEEAALRGVLPQAEADAGAALSGMEPEDARLLFEIMGRPLVVHQITTGLARGGEYGGTYDDVPEPYRDAIRRSNIRPEYARLAYANRYSYPSAFVIRTLAQAGELTPAETLQTLLDIGWPPPFAEKVSAAWSGGTTSTGKEATKAELLDEFEGGFITESELRDHLTALGYTGPTQDLEVHLADARRIKGWRDKAITALNKSFVNSQMTDDEAKVILGELGVTDPDTQARLLTIWNIERGLP